MTDQPTFNPAYRVARCGDSSSHGPHVVDHGPDQPRNCPGSGNEWRWEPDSKGGWVSAPRCCEPTCPDFGDPDFGEGTCPSEHSPAHAPRGPLSATPAAQTGPARGSGCTEADASTEAVPCECAGFHLAAPQPPGPAWCRCGHERAVHVEGHGPCQREAVMLG